MPLKDMKDVLIQLSSEEFWKVRVILNPHERYIKRKYKNTEFIYQGREEQWDELYEENTIVVEKEMFPLTHVEDWNTQYGDKEGKYDIIIVRVPMEFFEMVKIGRRYLKDLVSKKDMKLYFVYRSNDIKNFDYE